MVNHSRGSPSKEVDDAPVKEWVKNYFDYVKRGEIDPWYSLWANDVTILPPNKPSVYGLEAWMKKTKPGFEKFSISHETIDLKVLMDSSIAYVRWIGVESITPKLGGETLRNENKCMWSLNHPPRGERSYAYEK